MEILVNGAQGSGPRGFGLDEIVAQRPPVKTVREFFRAQAAAICHREDEKMLQSAVQAPAPPKTRRTGKR